MYPGISEEIIAGIRGSGAAVHRVVENDLLIINDEISLAVTIARCKLAVAGNAR